MYEPSATSFQVTPPSVDSQVQVLCGGGVLRPGQSTLGRNWGGDSWGDTLVAAAQCLEQDPFLVPPTTSPPPSRPPHPSGSSSSPSPVADTTPVAMMKPGAEGLE